MFITCYVLTHFVSTSPYANDSAYRTCSVIDILEAPEQLKRVTMKSRNRGRDFVIGDLWTAMGRSRVADSAALSLNTFYSGYATSAYMPSIASSCENQLDRINMSIKLIGQLTKWCYAVAKTFRDGAGDSYVFPSVVCVVWLRMNPKQVHYTPAIFFSCPNPSTIPFRQKRAKDMIQSLRKGEMAAYVGMVALPALPISQAVDYGYCAENSALM